MTELDGFLITMLFFGVLGVIAMCLGYLVLAKNDYDKSQLSDSVSKELQKLLDKEKGK